MKGSTIPTAIAAPGEEISAQPSRTQWFESRWLWLILAILSTSPILFSSFPPMPDYYSHVGGYYVMVHRSDPLLSSYYDFHWFLTGNLGVDLMVRGLAAILPFDAAVRLAAISIPFLTTLGILALAKAAHGTVPPTAFLALPLVWTFPLLFGFVNFSLGIALALLIAAWWVRRLRQGGLVGTAVAALLAGLLWVCHLAAFAVFLIIVTGWEMARLDWRNPLRASVSLGFKVGPVAWPLLLSAIPKHVDHQPSLLGAWMLRPKIGMSLQLFRSINPLVDHATILLLIATAAACYFLILKKRGSASLGLFVPGCMLILLWAAMPQVLLGSEYADLRLLPAIFVLMLLAVRRVPAWLGKTAAVVGLAVFVARLLLLSLDWHGRAALAEQELAVLNGVPNGARIASFATDSVCGPWPMTGYDHLPSMAIVRRRAFVNSEWDLPTAIPTRPLYNRGRGYNDASSTVIGDPAFVHCNGPSIGERLDHLPQDRFDYVWTFSAPIASERYPWLREEARGPSGVLYRIVRASGPATPRRSTPPASRPSVPAA